MYSITTEQSFDSAHFLAGYQGKCGNIHGHRWRVVVEVQSEELRDDTQQKGMCMDFVDLKKDLGELVDLFDHMFIVEEGTLKSTTIQVLEEEGFRMKYVTFRPTAENFSKYFYEEMEKKGYDVFAVSVYETPNNCATYRKN